MADAGTLRESEREREVSGREKDSEWEGERKRESEWGRERDREIERLQDGRSHHVQLQVDIRTSAVSGDRGYNPV